MLRRFGLQYEVPLPAPAQRREILAKYLRRHDLESSALQRMGLLAPGEGGVDPALLQDRCGGPCTSVVYLAQGELLASCRYTAESND